MDCGRKSVHAQSLHAKNIVSSCDTYEIDKGILHRFEKCVDSSRH